MRTRLASTAALLLPLAVLLVGCGSEPASRAQTTDSKSRAREVAEAWDGSRAAEVWRQGYYPLADTVQLPKDAFHDEEDKEAYLNRNLVLDTELPTGSPQKGKVTWEGGGALSLPLMAPDEAFRGVSGNEGDGPRLTVTAVKLGEASLLTSRGPATVPAWLFTLKGYDTPLKRVALAASQLPEPPIKPAGDTSDDLMDLAGLSSVSEDGRSVTVDAYHGACDDGPRVHVLETDGSVVLSASIVGTSDGSCTSNLLSRKVTVKLESPLGDRVLLDAFAGAPVPQGRHVT
ncbi:hypothetical protein [Streptomyces sp. RG80]|uniref:hypothetical protein n=1 Tax=Streptomyces sp. RG80 TaxID=3157340 RepID=UPI00338E8EB9